LLIRVHRCGICGSDLHLTDTHARWQVPVGTVLGHEFAGEVVELGEGTHPDWREGDRLAALPYIGCGTCFECLSGNPFHCPKVLCLPTGDLVGGYGEYAVVGAREAARLRDDVTWEEGAFTEPLAVGLHAVAMSGLRPGQPVLVLGAGPIGLSAAACAKAFGAGPVVVSARTDRHADLAIKMGATAFFLNDEHLGEHFRNHAGGPPEVVIECAGVPGMLERCADLVAVKGRIVIAGGCNGPDPLYVITPTVKELNYQFIATYSIREFATAQEMIASRRIDPAPMLNGTLTLDELPEVFENLRHNKNSCKLMVTNAS
jgi:(R,R)-butanediol dehydrogenase/meso-butanediol dehydrogenase/diacetyl reductase